MKQTGTFIEETGAQCGLVGFFDLLGYKSIVENNTIGELIFVVKKIQETIRESLRQLHVTEDCLSQALPSHENVGSIEHVVFSDSIFICTTYPETERELRIQAAKFNEFCSDLVSGLFWAGLPVRGALAFGDYFVERTEMGIFLAGAPIVEAHELSNCFDMSACVIAPSAEGVLAKMQILASSSEVQAGYTHQRVPLKGNQRQEMCLLDRYSRDLSYHPDRTISRQIVMQKFADHKKRITVEVLPKVNNTLGFLEASRRQ